MALDTQDPRSSSPSSRPPYSGYTAGDAWADLSWEETPTRSPWRWVRRLALVGILCGGLAAGGTVVWQRTQERAREELLDLAVPVQTQDLTQRLRVSGRVQAVRQVNVSPRESGQLLDLYADEGDRVEEGQLLALMDYGNLSGDLVQAQGRIAELEARLAELRAGERQQTIQAAQAQVDRAEAQYELAQSEARRQQLLADQGGISRNELEVRLTALDQARADLEAAQQDLDRLQAGTRPEVIQQIEAQVRQAQGVLERQQARIDDTQVRAPFSGVVIQRFADVGSFVAPTTSASEVTAASSSSILSLAQGLEIRADVPEAQIGTVQVGQPVEIRSPAFPDQVIAGQVKRISPATVVVREVTIFRVIIAPTVEAGSESRLLRIGMNVSVDLIGEEKPETLTIPSVAVIYEDNQEGVILWDEEQRQARYRSVETGITQSGLTEILSGLSPEDRVFTSLPPGRTLEDLRRESTAEEAAANPGS